MLFIDVVIILWFLSSLNVPTWDDEVTFIGGFWRISVVKHYVALRTLQYQEGDQRRHLLMWFACWS